nr:hypothetical protein [Tanacetum cinerariifolium]
MTGDHASTAPLTISLSNKLMEAWDIVALIFNDNKRSRSIALKVKLRLMKLGDLSIDAYFRKIEYVRKFLSSLGSPISNDDVVNIALDGLPDKYQHVSDLIIHRDPFPDLKTVHSMPTTTKMLKVHKPCNNSNKGSCRFGEYCKFLHNGAHGNPSLWSNSAHNPKVHNGYCIRRTVYYPSGHLAQFITQPTQVLSQLMNPGQAIQPCQPVNLGQLGPSGNLFMDISRDPASGNWNMDPDASSHVNDSISSLSDV